MIEIESLCHDRDRTYWACSAQNDKLLPKPNVPPGTGAAQMKAVVQRMAERGGY